jgi:hypothetical protein
MLISLGLTIEKLRALGNSMEPMPTHSKTQKGAVVPDFDIFITFFTQLITHYQCNPHNMMLLR